MYIDSPENSSTFDVSSTAITNRADVDSFSEKNSNGGEPPFSKIEGTSRIMCVLLPGSV